MAIRPPIPAVHPACHQEVAGRSSRRLTTPSPRKPSKRAPVSRNFGVFGVIHNYGYRYFHPELGRWISRDPIGEKGGENLYVFAGNVTTSKIDMLGQWAVDIGVGFSFTAAATLGGLTGGIEIGVGKTYMFSSSYGDFDCIQCTASFKVGFGVGELNAGFGLIGSGGDDAWVGEGKTTSSGVGFNFTPEPPPFPGLSGGGSKPDPGSGNGYGVNAGDPIGLSWGGGVNFYKSKTYSGKVCEKRSYYDPLGLVSSVKVALRLDECINMAIDAMLAELGMPNFLKQVK